MFGALVELAIARSAMMPVSTSGSIVTIAGVCHARSFLGCVGRFRALVAVFSFFASLLIF